MRTTRLQSLVDLKLGGSLRRVVFDARAEGKSWRAIAADLSEATGEPVTHESVRSWFVDEADAVVSSALRDAGLKAAS